MLLREIYGINLNEAVGQYLDRITTGKIGKLNPDSLLRQIIPRDAVFFVFDTETTGLNMFKTDLVTEVAVIAYDRNFNFIDRYHASAEVPEEETPVAIANRAKQKFMRILDLDEETADKYAKKAVKLFLKHARGHEDAASSREEMYRFLNSNSKWTFGRMENFLQ